MLRVFFFPLMQVPLSHLSVGLGVGDFHVDRARGLRRVEELLEKGAAPPASGAGSEAVCELTDPLRPLDAQIVHHLTTGDVEAEAEFVIEVHRAVSPYAVWARRRATSSARWRAHPEAVGTLYRDVRRASTMIGLCRVIPQGICASIQLSTLMAETSPLLRALTDGTFDAWLVEHGQPAFRRRQVERWVARAATGFDQMSDLPSGLRAALNRDFTLRTSRVVRHLRDRDGTEKLLLEWPGGGRIEGVLLREGHRRTICISTQVGCAMGCVFCASGLEGLERNLTSEEILEQALRLAECLAPHERLSHVVVMGMGEPLADLDALLPALDWIASPRGFDISARRITISTVGLPGAIRRLARHSRPFRLAVSLHAADDALRAEIVPVSRSTGIALLLEAVDDYFRSTGRRLTFEYTLLGGINDRTVDARRLARLLANRTALINLIPYNRVPGLPFRTPAPAAIRRFREILEEGGIEVRVRKRKGARIDAACGQLRRRSRDGRETLSTGGGVE